MQLLVVEPTAALDVPATQDVQLVEPVVAAYVPAAHDAHAAAEPAPTAALNLPSGQGRQTLAAPAPVDAE